MHSRKKTLRIFWSILALTLFCLVINFPKQLPLKIHSGPINWEHTFYRPQLNLKIGNNVINNHFDLKYVLDLAGGSSLIFDIETSYRDPQELPQALESLKTNIERRINLFGVSETNIRIDKLQSQYRLQVDLPGIENTADAIDLIGTTAQLGFYGVVDDKLFTEATSSAEFLSAIKDTGLNGSHLKNSSVQINPHNSRPEVSLEFNDEGSKLFAQATKDYLNQRIVI